MSVSDQKQKLFTALHDIHTSLSNMMVVFAGYELPLYYKATNTLEEHQHTRNSASIFDVSHMGQVILKGPDIPNLLEKLTPSLFHNMKDGRAKYTVLLNEQGGITDDFIASKLSDDMYYLVLNASRKHQDIAHIQKYMTPEQSLQVMEEQSLIAVQGPLAIQALSTIIPEITEMKKFDVCSTQWQGHKILISMVGYTGEDGCEISLPNEAASQMWKDLSNHQHIQPAGLGARDSLRIEAGYPLYGSDMDERHSPVQANMRWLVKQYNCLGGERLKREMDTWDSPEENFMIRVGIRVLTKGKIPRAGDKITRDGVEIGHITSGIFSPTLKEGIAQGYIKKSQISVDRNATVIIRNNPADCEIVELSFLNKK